MKQKVLISRMIRLSLSLMLTALIGLNAATQTPGSITIKVRQFDAMAQDIMIGDKLNAINRNYIDTVKKLYYNLALQYDSSQANVAALLRQRDTAQKRIDDLEAQVRGLKVDNATANARANKEAQKKEKNIGIMFVPLEYDVFRKQVSAGFKIALGYTPKWLRISTKGVRFTDTGDIEIPRQSDAQRVLVNQVLR